MVVMLSVFKHKPEAENKDTIESQDQVFIRDLITLHDRLFNVYVRSLLSSKIHTCCQVPIWIWQLWSQILNQQKYYIWKTMREDMMSLLWHNFKDMVPLATIPVVIDKSIVGP
ncbi:uncharacterized protein LOC131233851 isoform X2 [Magnolia sinica]|uniref:uncharacterized protein LOC131233851 isoform X2 n=1 Tax=Magnolia sinica TaxID=86752 RepID=UPI002658374C|nr:uncharacterized protein LOC131233851 isoform X2 [Magnolia sinica]